MNLTRRIRGDDNKLAASAREAISIRRFELSGRPDRFFPDEAGGRRLRSLGVFLTTQWEAAGAAPCLVRRTAATP